MDIHYSVNGVSSLLKLPNWYTDECTPESLAELAASDFWRNRPTEAPHSDKPGAFAERGR